MASVSFENWQESQADQRNPYTPEEIADSVRTTSGSGDTAGTFAPERVQYGRGTINEPPPAPAAPSAQSAPTAPYYGPFAPGVVPGPGEGDAQHNPNFNGPSGGNQAGNLSAVEQQLKQRLGGLYDSSILGDVVRNTSYANNTGDLQSWIDRIVNKNLLRGTNEANSTYTPNGQGGYTTGPTGKINTPQAGAGSPAFQIPQSKGTGPGGGSPSMPSFGSQGAPLSWTGPPATNVPSQFSDPISSFLEKFAQQQAQRLENPPSGSGQQLFEQILNNISQQFQNGGYTPAEQELLSTQAIEPIEQLRKARKDQVIQTLAARGVGPDSGVYKQMLADVDRQFDAMRAQQQTQLGANAANERTQRMMSAVQLLQNLAGTQDQRLGSAFNYRSVPYNMAQQSFQNASQLYGSAGNPLSLVNPLLQLQEQQNAKTQAQQESLGYLIAMLTGLGQRPGA